MSKLILMALVFVAMTVGACGGSNGRKAEIAPTYTASPASHNSSQLRVRLEVVQTTDRTLYFELRNDSTHPIFVSYTPENDGATTSFLTYNLLKKSVTDGEFTEYGEQFHFVPNLHPIDAQRVVSFHLVNYPNEKGEYRVRVGYHDDQEVYKMISERLLEMTDAERERAKQSSKYVLSDSFFVPSSRKVK